jgi:hypothetical protein
VEDLITSSCHKTRFVIPLNTAIMISHIVRYAEKQWFDPRIRGGIHNLWDWCCHSYSSCSRAMQRYMIVLTYLGSQRTKFYSAGWTCWLFMSFYMESCIWPDAIFQWIRHTNSIKFWANLGKSAMKTLAMIRQVFMEESMSHTQVFEWYARLRADRIWRDR